MNRRTGKVVSNSGDLDGTTRYIYSSWQVIEEWDGSDNLVRSYVYGSYIDEPITMTDSTDTYYYLANTQYSVAAITDSTGTVVESYRYTPYGKPTILDGQGQEIATSAIGNPYMFTGRRLDTETGLYHYRTRYYSADLGRFVSADLIGYLAGMNLYAYVLNNPLMWMDPFGLCSQDSQQQYSQAEWDDLRFQGLVEGPFPPNIDPTHGFPSSFSTPTLDAWSDAAGQFAFNFLLGVASRAGTSAVSGLINATYGDIVAEGAGNYQQAMENLEARDEDLDALME